MKVNFAVLAQGASTDIINNTITISSVVEGIQAKEFPTQLENLVFIIFLRRQINESSTGKIKLSIEGQIPNLEKELNFNFSGELTKPMEIKDNVTCKLLLALPTLTIKNPGEIKFIIKYNNKKIGEYEISTWK